MSTIADNINKNLANETFIVAGEGISRNEETFREGLIVMAGGEGMTRNTFIHNR